MIAVLVAACGRSEPPAALEVELLFAGGQILDGSGEPAYAADVGIIGGHISFIGDARTERVVSHETIDVSGRWIAPGFIDAHSHAELDEDYGRDALPYLYQGITTVVLGVDGDGTSDVASRFDGWRSNGIGANAIHYVGHGAIREQVMGRDDRPPTAAELDAMKLLVRKGMREGAFGLSTGLFYVPGTYASTDEVIELAREAAAFEGAIYDTHDRDLGAVYQGIGYEASVREGISISEAAGLRAIFSHYNLQGARNYGRAEVGAELINSARARGVDVWAAHHPYTATQSNLRSYTIPDWAAAGGHDVMVERFNDPDTSALIAEATIAMLEIRGGADKIMFVEPQPDLNGRTLAEIAAERELSPPAAVQQILRTGNKSVMNLELYDHENTRRLAMEPWMMTCTDGRTPEPDQAMTHPRTFGAFPMKMRLFVFDEEVLEVQAVIRSFSGLAADFFRLPDRGYLREGYIADIAVIDPDRYRDLATFEEPQQLARGVEYLLVNGEFAIRDGAATGILAGQPITRPD